MNVSDQLSPNDSSETTTGSSKSNPAEEYRDEPAPEFWLQEYRSLSSLFQKFMELYINCFVIYLGFQGLMLKFAFEKDAPTELRRVLGYYGLAGCVLLFLLILGGERTARGMRSRYDETISHLKAPAYNYFWPTRWFSIGFGIFNISAVVVILYLLSRLS